MAEDKVYSLMDAYHGILTAVRNCEANHKDPNEVPFVIKEGWHRYKPFSTYVGVGDGVEAGIEFFKSDEIKVEVPDVRPDGGGEYWQSRGLSHYDVSGFVKSKQAGERLLRFVKYVLENDKPKTFLDYRESEPKWIQFKFSAEEFYISQLEVMAKANNDIITEEIIRKCVKHKEGETEQSTTLP